MTAVAIVLLWPGSASALQPIEPLGGQLQLTAQGPVSDATFDVDRADIAYNSVRNQFLLVWEQRILAGETEIFGRILNGDGTPAAPAFRVSRTPDPDLPNPPPDVTGLDSFDPAVAYDPERDRYGVVWSGDFSTAGEQEIFLQVLSGAGALVDRDTGAPPTTAAPAERISSIGASGNTAQDALAPDIAYRPDVDGVATSFAGDAWAIVYSGNEAPNVNEIWTQRVPATAFVFIFSDSRVSDLDPDGNGLDPSGDGSDPTVAVIPGSEDYAVAWAGDTSASSDREIYAHRVVTTGTFTPGQAQITTTGVATAGSANAPSITADPNASQLLVAYFGNDVPGDNQVWVQRLNFTIGQIGGDQQVSSAGPLDSGSQVVGSPQALYHPGVGRHLITWFGTDPDRLGSPGDEREVQGTTLDANGVEGNPQDFAISRMGNDGDEDASPTTTSIALNTQSGRWLSVWTSDDARGDLVDGELEAWGREVGENFDVDGDGVNVPADCNDGNPVIRPGAVDVFDNGVDEDCSGADAENPDRDGDGVARPSDCDDGNPFIRPGATDVPNNEVDEDCSNGPRRTLVDVDIERAFAVFTRHTRVTRLRVKKLRPGMRIELRCKGKKCPKKLRKGKVRRVNVTKSGSHSFTKLFKKARLKPKAVVDVRVFQPGAIARVDKFVMRKAKLPTRRQRCIPPGTTKPAKC